MRVFFINKKLEIVLIALTILFAGITLILYCIIFGTNGIKVIGTEFIKKRVPVALSDNFGVDSKERIYFTSQTHPLIQVFDKNEYLYSLDLQKQLNNYGGAKYIYITEYDNIEILFVRTYTMATFNQKGQLIEEKELDKENFRQFMHDLIPSDYRVEKQGSLYEAMPLNNFFYSIYKSTGDERNVIYKTTVEETAYMIFKIIAICLTICLVVIWIASKSLHKLKF